MATVHADRLSLSLSAAGCRVLRRDDPQRPYVVEAVAGDATVQIVLSLEEIDALGEQICALRAADLAAVPRGPYIVVLYSDCRAFAGGAKISLLEHADAYAQRRSAGPQWNTAVVQDRDGNEIARYRDGERVATEIQPVPEVVVTPPWVGHGTPVQPAPDARTPNQVLTQRLSHAGCCVRFADNQGCDCLTLALMCQQARNASRTRTGNPSGCNVCQDPNCTNPNEKH